MQQFTDQTGHTATLTRIPLRIVSLVPSQTELLYALGLDKEVVGITKFCIHPPHWFATKQRIGGTKTVDLEKVMALQPDLVIANKEENTRKQVEALQQLLPVYTSDINTLKDALQMIGDIGKLVGKDVASTAVITNIQAAFAALEQEVPKVSPLEQRRNSTLQIKAAYLIWKDPWMAAGGDTFIHDMLERCGCTNVFSNTARYPEITVQEMASLGCNLLLLSSEPYPFKQKHIDALQQQMPGTQILLVDGEMFSWYGSRLQYAAEYFMQLRETLLSNQLH